MQTSTTRGSLPEILRNDENLYLGNLVYYFGVVWRQAQNLQKPYHNFRHMFHVLYMCYQACVFYADELSPREMRNLLIAAMFHDFDHSGMMGNDDLNIERAIRGLRKHLLSEDQPESENIAGLIRATEYPYKVPSENLCGLLAPILRDADMSRVSAPHGFNKLSSGSPPNGARNRSMSSRDKWLSLRT